MDENISEKEIQETLGKIKDGKADIGDILDLYGAGADLNSEILPKVLTEAIEGVFMSERDFNNGGADQFVWNHGIEISKTLGQTWRKVGAIENGDLLIRLSEALDSYKTEVGVERLKGESVNHFLQYRKRVNGPYFGIPEPIEEVSEAAPEWATEHFDLFTFSEVKQ